MKLKKLFKFTICILSLILTIIYIIYRIFYTLPTTLGTLSLIFAVIILLVEIWESIDFFTYFINILLTNKKSPKIPDFNIIKEIPDIDVFIATYNESPNILTRTIEACKNMEYPDKNKIHIYVCDDGDRLEIKDLTIKMNVNYISRSNRKDAKAGNYNNALLKTTGGPEKANGRHK